jgi:hypothetical protein
MGHGVDGEISGQAPGAIGDAGSDGDGESCLQGDIGRSAGRLLADREGVGRLAPSDP